MAYKTPFFDHTARRHSDTAAPQFDLSQLTALQQQYANPQQQQQQPPPPQQQQQIQQAALSHFPPGGLAQPTKPPQPAEASGASTWPPAQNPSAGDLSDFDPFSFDPTRPENWAPLAQRWANTYGYMPSLSELGLNFCELSQRRTTFVNGAVHLADVKDAQLAPWSYLSSDVLSNGNDAATTTAARRYGRWRFFDVRSRDHISQSPFEGCRYMLGTTSMRKGAKKV